MTPVLGLIGKRVGAIATISIGLLFAWRGVANAQPAPQAEGILYEQATHEAVLVAPDLASGRARSSVSAAGVGVAGIFTNPVVSLGSSTDGPRFAASLSIPLPITRRSPAIRAARSSAEAAAADLPILQLDARQAAANAWCDLWLAERTMEVANENDVRSAQIVSAAEQRFAEGSAPRLDAARAKAEHARVHAEALAFAELVADASAALAYWLGRDPSVKLHVTSAPRDPGNLLALPVLLGRLEGHPLFSRSAARSRAAAAAVSVERDRAWPTFAVQLGGTAADRNAPVNNFSAGIAFDLPLFNLNGPGIRQAESGASLVTAESNQASARLRSDLVSAYAVLKAAMVRADAAENDVLPATRIAADLTRDAYQTGAADLSAVLVAEKALADAKQSAFDAVATRGRALAALERALGSTL